MDITMYLAMFAVAVSATVFFLARKRVGAGAAAGPSALTFLGGVAASILAIQVALSGTGN